MYNSKAMSSYMLLGDIDIKKIIVNMPFIFMFMSLVYIGPMIAPDSGGYITASFVRSPLYPSILQVMRAIFGTNNFYPLIILQLCCGFFACNVLALHFRKIFNLSYYFYKVLFFILLMPYFAPSKIGNSILTEPICYPLFVLTVSKLLDGFLEKNVKSLLISIGLISLLILTRKQFLFLYPVIIAMLICFFYRYPKGFKKLLLLTFCVLSIFLTNVLEKSYNYMNHGFFEGIPFTGVQLINAPMFVAKASDENLLPDKLQKQVFHNAHQEMQKKGIVDRLPDPSSILAGLSDIEIFNASYNIICYRIISKYLPSMHIVESDKFLIKMSLALIKINFPKYFKLYVNNIVHSLGGYFYSFLILALFIASSIVCLTKHNNKYSTTIFIITFLNLANYGFVALVEPVLNRYSIYTDTVQLCLLFIVIATVFKKTNYKPSEPI